MLCNGCKLWDELNTPVRKSKTAKKPEPKPYEPTILPDGTTKGLNKYEMEYVKDIEGDFEKRRRQNYRKIFGGSGS
jgi:hypothetical protein